MKKSMKIVLMGLLVALDVVAAHFLTIKTPLLKIGVSFIPVSYTGILFGPVFGGIGAAMADVIQYLLYPMGAYIPGITIDQFLSGAVYGILLYKKEPSILRILIAAAICELVISGVFTTFWLYLVTPGKTFMALFLMRIVKSLIMTPIETIIIYAVLKVTKKTKVLSF